MSNLVGGFGKINVVKKKKKLWGKASTLIKAKTISDWLQAHFQRRGGLSQKPGKRGDDW